MRTGLLSFVLRATAPSAALGLVLGASLIVVESLVVYLVNQVAPGNAFRVIYLLGVVLVSTLWGFGLALATSVASAIANAQTRAELTASRARIVLAGDDARRRFERDLHDGAQQRLVTLGLELRAAEASVRPEQRALRAQICQIATSLAGVSGELREISHGIYPGILSKGGLGAALKALARRSTVPVELDLTLDRQLPESVVVAAYFVLAEALTNAAKHAQASKVNVLVDAEAADLRVSIRDDGIGGADATRGSGLSGLVDRVEALGGQMTISSHRGSGTSLLVKIPLEVPEAAARAAARRRARLRASRR